MVFTIVYLAMMRMIALIVIIKLLLFFISIFIFIFFYSNKEIFHSKGFFKCSRQIHFINISNVCDGNIDCLGGNDEIFCSNQSFPINQCHIKYFNHLVCNDLKSLQNFYIDFKMFIINNSKILLNLNSNGFHKITNLKIINSSLSNNLFFKKFPNLVQLIFNKISFHSSQIFSSTKLKILQFLDLSYNQIYSLDFLKNFTSDKLLFLDISHTKISKIGNVDIRHLSRLRILKASYCSLKIIEINWLKRLHEIHLNKTIINEKDLLNIHEHLSELKYFYSSSFYLCCLMLKNYNNSIVCRPNISVVKSCSKMIKSLILSLAFWIIGLLGFLGNCFTLIYVIPRLKVSRLYQFIMSLSDLLVCCYILSISILNVYFGDDYLNYDWKWRHSFYCKLHGILLTFSLHLSYLSMILMTLERYFTLKNPLKSNILKKYEQIFTIAGVFIAFLISCIPIAFDVSM